MLDVFVSHINQLLPEPHASLLAGMLFGVRRDMPADFYDKLIATGTLHVIALSGMNISIITRVLFDTLGTYLGKYIGITSTILAIILFIFLVGPSETIIRAAIMGVLSILAVLFGRKDIPLISLLFAVFSMILINPEVVSSISFQLSVGATLGIILFAGNDVQTAINQHTSGKSSILGSIDVLLKSTRQFIRNDLRVTLSAQIFTVPLILFYFNRISLVSPVANVFTGWLVPPIMYLGFLLVVFSLIWWPLARLMALVVWVPLSLFILIINLLSGLPFASLTL